MGALSDYDKRRLRAAGFIKMEIDCFDNAKAVDGSEQDLNTKSENWNSMIESRRKWITMLKSKGWPDAEIYFRIKMLYEGHRSRRDAFMLLQAEVSPSQRNKKLTDNAEFRRRLVRTRITRTLGAAYGKDFRAASLPRHIPKPPQAPPRSQN